MDAVSSDTKQLNIERIFKSIMKQEKEVFQCTLYFVL